MKNLIGLGRVWSDLCNRLPGLVGRGKVREAILDLPLVAGTPDVIPDDALWAAVVCLGILASIYRYEEQNHGREGLILHLYKWLNQFQASSKAPYRPWRKIVFLIPLMNQRQM